MAKTLDRLAELHSPSGFWSRLFGRMLSRRVREEWAQAQAERAEALEIARQYPENPDCKRILEKSKK